MKLYGIPISPFTRKVRVALELKGLKYEMENIYPGTKTTEYLAISPLGKIPALEDGNTIICDSNVIIEYLEEQYPSIPVRPSNIVERAKCRWLEEYADSMLFKPCAGNIFMECLTKPFKSNKQTDDKVVKYSIDNLLPPLFNYIESQLPKEGFIFGEIGIADIAVATALINATYTDFEVDKVLWPKLANHLSIVKTHPVVVKCMQTEEPMIAALINDRNKRLLKAS